MNKIPDNDVDAERHLHELFPPAADCEFVVRAYRTLRGRRVPIRQALDEAYLAGRWICSGEVPLPVAASTPATRKPRLEFTTDLKAHLSAAALFRIKELDLVMRDPFIDNGKTADEMCDEAVTLIESLERRLGQ